MFFFFFPPLLIITIAYLIEFLYLNLMKNEMFGDLKQIK